MIFFLGMDALMRIALEEAGKAAEHGDVPIGAVLAKNGQVIAKAHNRVEEDQDPTAHAEILAIRAGAKEIGYKHLANTELYVTCEPCSMCAGAILLARIPRLIIGTPDPKTGACGSRYNIVEEGLLNHRVEVQRGVLKRECSAILKEFFSDIRKRKKKSEED